jgi:DNA repair exonuclease SbcCD ATPase subunit
MVDQTRESQQKAELELTGSRKRAEASENRQQELSARFEGQLAEMKMRLESQTDSMESRSQDAQRFAKEKDQLQAQLVRAEDEISSLLNRLNETEKNVDTAASLKARLEGLEVEREELLRQNQELNAKMDQLREKALEGEKSAKHSAESEQLRQELMMLKDQLKSSKAMSMNLDGIALLDEVEELEKRKAALSRDLAQAKTTILDAASIVGKQKAKDDKIEALSRELKDLREKLGMPASVAALPNQSSRGDAHRSFGRGVPPPAESREPTTHKLKSNTASEAASDSPSAAAKATDNRNKFARSLFGSVRAKSGK